MLYEIYQKMVSSISKNLDFGAASSFNKLKRPLSYAGFD